MISGPILTRTRDGLRNVLRQHLEGAERGLVVVQDDLLFEGGCRVDALARDAHGTPVLLFLVMPEEDRDLAGRVLDAQAWMTANPRLLAQALPLRGVRYDQAPRVVVVGFEIPEALLGRLATLRLPSLDVYQVSWFSAGGELKVGMVPLVGAALAGEQDGFRVPAGIDDPRQRSLCSRFLDLLQRLDPGLEVFGDRFSRRFSLAGRAVGELRQVDGRLQFEVPRGDQAAAVFELSSWSDCEGAADAAMRRYLACSVPTSEPVDDLVGPPSFSSIRRSVAQVQLSREEYSALGGGSLASERS